MKKLHFVFVYGTLKRGFYNYKIYLEPAVKLGKAHFVGSGQSVSSDFYLVVGKDEELDEFVPCLFRNTTAFESKARAHVICGDVFQVDDDTLAALDILEEIEKGHYYKETIQVQVEKKQVVDCIAYLKPFKPALLQMERIEEYTHAHGLAYVPNTGELPMFEALEFIYGKQTIARVKSALLVHESSHWTFDQALEQAIQAIQADTSSTIEET